VPPPETLFQNVLTSELKLVHFLVHSACYFADRSNLKLYLLLCFISVFAPPPSEGVWEGAVPPPQKFFGLLSRKWRVFGAFWCHFYVELFLVIKNKFTSKLNLSFKISSHFSGKRSPPCLPHKSASALPFLLPLPILLPFPSTLIWLKCLGERIAIDTPTTKLCYCKDYRGMRVTAQSDNTYMVCC